MQQCDFDWLYKQLLATRGQVIVARDCHTKSRLSQRVRLTPRTPGSREAPGTNRTAAGLTTSGRQPARAALSDTPAPPGHQQTGDRQKGISQSSRPAGSIRTVRSGGTSRIEA